MVVETTRKAKTANAENVIAERRDFVTEGSGRPDKSVTYAMMFNLLHLEDPVGLLRESYRILIPGGMAGIIHWRSDVPTPRGPSLDIRPTPEHCRFWGDQAGLEYIRVESFSCCSWHLGMILRRP